MTTKEYMEELLNKYQNDSECRFDFDYYSEKNKNPFQWKVLLEGLQGSIYEGGYYMVRIDFSTSYPTSRPSLCFLNKIFHPHISESGSVCISESPKNDILTVLEVVENMFLDYDADIDHAYGQDPRALLEAKKREEFIKKAKDWVKEYAKLEDIDRFYDL
jgi:ubiquitin-protein ligase